MSQLTHAGKAIWEQSLKSKTSIIKFCAMYNALKKPDGTFYSGMVEIWRFLTHLGDNADTLLEKIAAKLYATSDSKKAAKKAGLLSLLFCLTFFSEIRQCRNSKHPDRRRRRRCRCNCGFSCPQRHASACYP
jgi:hypothetical protein